MRIVILLIGLLFFGCKTIQLNTEHTIDYSDVKIKGSCGVYVHESKITGKPLEGSYKVVFWKGYSISKFKKGLIQSKKYLLQKKHHEIH